MIIICHHHRQHRHHNPHHRHHHHRWNSLNNQSPVLTLSQPFSGSCSHSAPVFIFLCIFCGCVFDTERCLWHRKMGLTQKDVFHTERCLWRRKMSLTQNDIFDTERCLWHKKMCLTQRDVNEEFTNLQKLLKVFRRRPCEFSLESLHVWMWIVSSLTILSYYPWTQEYPCITGAPSKCFIAFVKFVFADNCCQWSVE